jgi:hypothetical protein
MHTLGPKKGRQAGPSASRRRAIGGRSPRPVQQPARSMKGRQAGRPISEQLKEAELIWPEKGRQAGQVNFAVASGILRANFCELLPGLNQLCSRLRHRD